MNIVIGAVVVIVCVISGYLMAHGILGVLFQPSEFIVIGGAAVGSLIIGTPMPVVKEIVSGLLGHITGKTIKHGDSLTTLQVLHELAATMRKEGKLALEPHLENPEGSSIFGKLGSHHRIMEVLADGLRMVTMDTDPAQLSEMMDKDLETREEELVEPAEALSHVADALPGLGIVAAVLGIINTMNSIGGDSAAVGEHVAAALVGTFLGVLLAYGFLGPMAQILKRIALNEIALLRAAATGVMMIAEEANPLVVCEAARRSIPEEMRPKFAEMETLLRG